MQNVSCASAALVLALLAGACGGDAPPPPPPPEIPVVEVAARDVPVYIEAIGETKGDLDIAIRARVEGTLEEMHFTEGSVVEKGKLLYVIDPSPYEAQVREAKGRLAEARARFVRAESDLNRVRPLVEIDALSKRTLDDATAEFEASKGLVEAAEAIVENAEIELGYTRIESPIDGLIGVSEAYVGDFVGRFPNPVVLSTVSRLDPIRARFSISERDYLILARRHVAAGEESTRPKESTLEMFLADGSLHVHRGRLEFVGREIDATTGTLMIEASFPNPDESLRPGQFARIRGQVETKEGAAIVPQRAVQEVQGTYNVAVIGEDGTVELRRVQPAERVDDLWVIDDGLEVGETIAVSGFHLLRPGVKVTPVREAPAEEQLR